MYPVATSENENVVLQYMHLTLGHANSRICACTETLHPRPQMFSVRTSRGIRPTVELGIPLLAKRNVDNGVKLQRFGCTVAFLKVLLVIPIRRRNGSD